METSGAATKRQELISIQYLRGVAAMMVVIFHMVVNSSLFTGTPMIRHSYFLNAGVDIFFVISGFIMWHTTRARPVTPGGFLLDRIIRIVPLYWVVTIAVMAIALFLPGLMRSTVFDLQHGLASLFFIPVHHPLFPQQFWPVVVPGWSLNYEMFFYLVFAVSLMLPSRVQFGFLIASFLAIFFGAKLFHGEGLNVFFGDEINLEFLFGVALGEAAAKGLKLPKIVCVALVALGFALIAYSANIHVTRVMRWGLPALAIVAGAVFYERSTPAPHIASLKLIGDISYSLYLIHGLVIAGCRVILKRVLPDDFGWQGAFFGALVIIVASVIAAYFANRFIEKPASRYLKKAFGKVKKPVVQTQSSVAI